MRFYPHKCYHIYNQGNNQKRIFLTAANYLFFLQKMRRHLLPHSRVLAYCLMPNHFHWFVYVKEDRKNVQQHGTNHPLIKGIAILLRSYTQAFNNRYNQSGSLFRQRTKSKEVDTKNYGITCLHYIHQNPIRANLVQEIGQWPYSSFLDYADFRSGTLVSKEFTSDYLDINEVSFIGESRQAIDPKF